MVYAKFGGQTECIMGNWQIENIDILKFILSTGAKSNETKVMILLITESPYEIGPFCVSILAKWGLHVGYVILFVIANSLPTSLPERRDFLRSCERLGCKNFCFENFE